MSAEMAMISQMVAKANNLTYNDVVTTVEIEKDVSIGDKLCVNKETGKLLPEESDIKGDVVNTVVSTTSASNAYYTDQNDRKLQYSWYKDTSSGEITKTLFAFYRSNTSFSIHPITTDSTTVGAKGANLSSSGYLPICVPAVSKNGMWSFSYTGYRYGHFTYYAINNASGAGAAHTYMYDSGSNDIFGEPPIDIKTLRANRCLGLWDNGGVSDTTPSNQRANLMVLRQQDSNAPELQAYVTISDIVGVDNATFLPISIRSGDADDVYLFYGTKFKKLAFTSLSDFDPDSVDMEYNSDIAANIDYVWMYQKGNYFIDYDATEVFSYDRANGQFLLMNDNQLSFKKYSSIGTTPSFPEKISIDKVDSTSYAIYSAYNGKHEFWKVTLDNDENTYTCNKLGSVPFSENIDESYRMYRLTDCTVTTNGIVGTTRVNRTSLESCNIPLSYTAPDIVKVKVTALEDGTAGGTIQAISDTAVYNIDTGTPGQEYMDKYVQTSTNKLLTKG